MPLCDSSPCPAITAVLHNCCQQTPKADASSPMGLAGPSCHSVNRQVLGASCMPSRSSRHQVGNLGAEGHNLWVTHSEGSPGVQSPSPTLKQPSCRGGRGWRSCRSSGLAASSGNTYSTSRSSAYVKAHTQQSPALLYQEHKSFQGTAVAAAFQSAALKKSCFLIFPRTVCQNQTPVCVTRQSPVQLPPHTGRYQPISHQQSTCMDGPLVPWCSPTSLEQHKGLQQKMLLEFPHFKLGGGWQNMLCFWRGSCPHDKLCSNALNNTVLLAWFLQMW